MENSLLFLNSFTLPDNLLYFLQREISDHLQALTQGSVEITMTRQSWIISFQRTRTGNWLPGCRGK